MSKLTYIFVHGLFGWGSYDAAYQRVPYWGMRGGDLIGYLRQQGFDCYAASVAPTGSAWDRACELYAQLSGTRVDYGKAHSKANHHERFGRDFSSMPLIPSWDEDTRLVLLGHSFGGATIRLFSELMAHGDKAEQDAGADSSLFLGGLERRIHTLVALAAPMNGTTAYDLFSDPAFDPDRVKVPRWSKGLARLMSMGTKPKKDGRDERDYADYDMHIDHAMEMNSRIATLPETYYFSVPCSKTKKCADGTWVPEKDMEPLFVMRGTQIGAYMGKTANGAVLDETWRENDGLVNTISAKAPSGAPSKPLDRGSISPGIWNVFPIVNGDHMWPQGGLLRRHDVREFYLDMLTLIDKLQKTGVITYRKLTEKDLDSFIRMRISQLREEGATENLDLTPALRDYYLRHLADGTFVSWLALDGDRIIGTSGMSFVEKPPYYGCPTGKIGLLSSMYTDPDYRRKGIAKELLSRVVEEARLYGCGTLQITASDMGVLLYTDFGFEKNENFMQYKLRKE